MSWINSNRWNRIRYTVIAPAYDFVARFDRQRQRSLELLALRHGERVLIVGGGTGADIPFIPSGVDIFAGDVTHAMVERMITRAGQEQRPISAAVMLDKFVAEGSRASPARRSARHSSEKGSTNLT